MELNKVVTIVYGVAVFGVALLVGLAMVKIVDTADQAERTAIANREAIVFICDTTEVLDLVVSDAAAQIQTNFDNGTYDRLLAQGVLTEENVAASRKTMESYREAHMVLQDRTSACSGVRHDTR